MRNVIIGLFFLFSSAGAHGASIVEFDKALTLKSVAEINSQKVCLQDLVADDWIKNRCNLDRAACCRWEMDGLTEKEFSRASIASEIANIQFPGFRLSLQGSVQKIKVTQTRRAIATTEISERLNVVIQKKYGIEQEVNVRSLNILNPIYLSLVEHTDWDVEVDNSFTDRIRLKLITNGEHRQVGYAEAAIQISTTSYVAKRTVRPNEEISPTDFEMKTISIPLTEYIRTAGNTTTTFPTSSRSRVTLHAGSPLAISAIEKLPAVKSGDTVTLVIRADSVRISTRGVVQTTASIGDTVSVAVPKYSRNFRGKLAEGKVVEVWL